MAVLGCHMNTCCNLLLCLQIDGNNFFMQKEKESNLRLLEARKLHTNQNPQFSHTQHG